MSRTFIPPLRLQGRGTAAAGGGGGAPFSAPAPNAPIRAADRPLDIIALTTHVLSDAACGVEGAAA